MDSASGGYMTNDLSKLLPKKHVVTFAQISGEVRERELSSLFLNEGSVYDPLLNVPPENRIKPRFSFNLQRYEQECRNSKKVDRQSSESLSDNSSQKTCSSVSPDDGAFLRNAFNAYQDVKCLFPEISKSGSEQLYPGTYKNYKRPDVGADIPEQCCISDNTAFRCGHAVARGVRSDSSSADSGDCPETERALNNKIKCKVFEPALKEQDLNSFVQNITDIQGNLMSKAHRKKAAAKYTGFLFENASPCTEPVAGFPVCDNKASESSSAPLLHCMSDEPAANAAVKGQIRKKETLSSVTEPYSDTFDDEDELSAADLDHLDLSPELKKNLEEVLKVSSLPFAVAYTAKRRRGLDNNMQAAQENIQSFSAERKSFISLNQAEDFFAETLQREAEAVKSASPDAQNLKNSISAEDMLSAEVLAWEQTHKFAVIFEDFVRNVGEHLRVELLSIKDSKYRKTCRFRNQFGDLISVCIFCKKSGEFSGCRCASDSHLEGLFKSAMTGKHITYDPAGRCMVY